MSQISKMLKVHGCSTWQKLTVRWSTTQGRTKKTFWTGCFAWQLHMHMKTKVSRLGCQRESLGKFFEQKYVGQPNNKEQIF